MQQSYFVCQYSLIIKQQLKIRIVVVGTFSFMRYAVGINPLRCMSS